MITMIIFCVIYIFAYLPILQAFHIRKLKQVHRTSNLRDLTVVSELHTCQISTF